MGRALAKPHLRLVGVDDGPFTRRHRYAPVAAVALSLPGSVEGISASRVRVDGNDATTRVIALLGALPQVGGARALLIDGVSLGGFNLVDLDRLHTALEIPVISVTRRSPDFAAIRSALSTYFPKEFRARWDLVRRHRPFPSPTGGKPIWIAAVGATRAQARLIVRRATLVGYWPEPLRLAHLVARAISGGPGTRGFGPGPRPPAARRRGR